MGNSRFLQLASPAAYGVYLVHWFLICWWLMAYVTMTKGIWEDFENGLTYDTATGTILQNEKYEEIRNTSKWLIVGAFFFVFIAANLTAWPLMYFVRQLPGFRNCL